MIHHFSFIQFFINLTCIQQIFDMYLPGTRDIMVNKTFDLHLLKMDHGEFLESSAPPSKNGTVGNRSHSKIWLQILSETYLSNLPLLRKNLCLCTEKNLDTPEKSLLKPPCLDNLAWSFGIHVSVINWAEFYYFVIDKSK